MEYVSHVCGGTYAEQMSEFYTLSYVMLHTEMYLDAEVFH